jgi:hypothetical protein
VPLPVQLLPGDVLIMGSDGLWDNVDDNEILDLVLTVHLSFPCRSAPSLVLMSWPLRIVSFICSVSVVLACTQC